MKTTLILILIMLVALPAFATTIVVDQWNGPFHTIADGYAACSDGDTLLLSPAIYYEALTISIPLTLQGMDVQSTIIWSTTTTITIANGDVFVQNLTVRGDTYGIRVTQETPIIQHCIIEQSGSGIYMDNDDVIIRNCIIRNCNDNGITTYGTLYNKIINNVIHDCNYGIYARSHLEICSNIIINCTYGVVGHSYDGNLYYNCFYNNTTNMHYVPIGPGNMEDQDPLFEDLSSSNYHLQTGSPCIDTGIPIGIYQDLDGTRNDMGIFGGQTPWGIGNPTVLDI
ncbi:MAG: right-handed parallel beta-helix repeat-containing protein, partial [Candidatus Cloacimonetes bacterium]|nr:right-handed parallel beta-helix repeat-containing protein [Candidatus Cloacimonadota bacterium]